MKTLSLPLTDSNLEVLYKARLKSYTTVYTQFFLALLFSLENKPERVVLLLNDEEFDENLEYELEGYSHLGPKSFEVNTKADFDELKDALEYRLDDLARVVRDALADYGHDLEFFEMAKLGFEFFERVKNNNVEKLFEKLKLEERTYLALLAKSL